MNGLNSFDKTDSSPTDDLIRCWRSNVSVTAGCRGQILWTPYLTNYSYL